MLPAIYIPLEKENCFVKSHRSRMAGSDPHHGKRYEKDS